MTSTNSQLHLPTQHPNQPQPPHAPPTTLTNHQPDGTTSAGQQSGPVSTTPTSLQAATTTSTAAAAASSSSSTSTNSTSSALATAASIAAASNAASANPSLPPVDLFFPNTNAPLVQHGAFTLSGQDCIALARMVDLLGRCGFTPANDARFASLLALWTFVHRYHRNSLAQKMVQAQQAKAMEAQLTIKTGLFTPIMHKQLLLQMKCASIVWIDQHIVSQMAHGVTYANKDISSGLLEVMRAFTKPQIVPTLAQTVDVNTQQGIINERKMMVQQQLLAAASSGGLSPALAAAVATGNLSALANDPTIAYFQTTSLHSLSYPPNPKQMESLPVLLGPKFMGTDPCTLMSELLYGAHLPPPAVDVRLLKNERDRMVRYQMKVRKEEIDMRLHEIRDSAPEDGPTHKSASILPSAGNTSLLTLTAASQHPSNKPPAWMEIDSLALGLVPLQRKIRTKILRALPVEVILKDAYRSRRDVEANQRIRDKAEKKTRLATEKHLKKTRKNYLNAITNHCRDFQMHHRELHKKLCKNICAGIEKYFEDRAKRLSDYEKSQEKQRLALLKDNNEEAYIALLKEAKNERLLNLLKQTDEYMDQLSKQIAQEQQAHQSKHDSTHHANIINHQPTADGHIPSAGEFMNGDVFSSSVAKWKKTDAELLDEAQDETPEEADRRRLQKIEAEERKIREEREGITEEKKSEDGAAPMDTTVGAAAADSTKLSVNTNGPIMDHSVEGSPTTTTGEGYQSTRKLYYSLAHKKAEEVVEQPKMLKGGQLRSYQLEGLQWLVSLYNNQLNGILADEMGLGKTVQSLSLLAYLMEVKHNYGPFLIIVPMSTLHNNWEYECDRWLPGIAKVVYDGDKDHRRYLRENFIKPGHFNIVMTTFEFAMRDKSTLRKIPWAYIIIDEAHRLKNPACKLAQELTTYPKESRRVALTGTPLQNQIHELWSLLNFLHPSIFNSSDSFEKWFSTPFDKMPVNTQDKEKHQGMNEEEKLLVINRLHSILRPFMLRREKKQVESDLADKIEKVLRCELSPMQKAMYESILEGKVTMHNRVMQLRKICNHPILFHPYLRNQAGANGYTPDETLVKMCGKFTLLDQILHKLKRTGHRVLIFNQMTRVMDVLEEYCNLRKFTFLRLDGSTSADVRTESLLKYNAPDSPYFIFMLSTKAGGLGLNLQSADTVILFDSDWNPQNDAQAMARSHRIGQKNQVIVLRFITTATVEERVLTTATTKLSHEQMVIQAGMFHDKYSHNASRAIAADAIAQTAKLEGDTGDDENDELWTDDFISRTLARSDAELAIFQEMDAIAKRSETIGKVSRGMPEGRMPKWCWDWCINGSEATSTDQTLVPFTEKTLDAARAKVIKSNSAEPLALKRQTKGAIVEVNTSDSDDEYDVVAEASGVNDAALDEDEERPINYDEIDYDDDQPLTVPVAATPVPTPASKRSKKAGTPTPSKRKTPAAKRKRDEPDTPQDSSMGGEAGGSGSASASTTPAPKKKKDADGNPTTKRSSTKKKATTATVAATPVPIMAAVIDEDDYQPLSYSDADDEDTAAMTDVTTYNHSGGGPAIAAVSSSGMKLVIRGGTPTSAGGASAAPKRIPKKKATPATTGGPVLIKKSNNTFSLSTAGIPR